MRLFVSAGLAALVTVALAAPQYTYVNLGTFTPAGSFSSSRGISTGGRAIFYTAGNNNIAYTWTESGGVQQFAAPGSSIQWRVETINDSGLGMGNTQVGNFGTQTPSYWNGVGSSATALTTAAGFPSGRVNRVNNHGVAVGSSGGGTSERAIMYTNFVGSVMTATVNGLPLITAQNMNDAGDVVGRYWINGNTVERAFYYNAASNSAIDLGLSGFTSSYGWAVNASGVVAGSSSSGADTRAWIWDSVNGIRQIFGPNASDNITPRAINASGWVVGNNFTANAAWLRDGTNTYTLNSLVEGGMPTGVSLQSAVGISDSGIIVGQSQATGGLIQAYALVPVPEPGTMAALGLGTLALLRRRKRAQEGRGRFLASPLWF